VTVGRSVNRIDSQTVMVLFPKSRAAMKQFDPQAYGPVFAPLLIGDRRRPLDAGSPDAAARAALEGLSIESALAHAKLVDGDMAACCMAGVWLLYDFLDESHAISQGIETASGSFWHAIMHRREGDFGNAKYWLRRVGRHPVFESIGQRAAELAAERGAESVVKKLIHEGTWDAPAFVDLCQAAIRDQTAEGPLCREIQQVEWERLFDFCYASAIGRAS
jgi:hypothetical protein